MPSLKINTIANMAGRLGMAALTLVTLPVIIRLIGIESYGVIGFFASLQAVFGLLDLGLSATVTREMARRSDDPADAASARDLLRTIEVVYWGIGLVIALISVAIAPLVATRWFRLQTLSPAVVQQAVMIMGFVTACQWPISMYDGALGGLQRQVATNVIGLTMTAARVGGAIAVLLWISPTVQAYLLTQGVMYAIQSIVTRVVLWRSMPPASGRPRFRTSALREIWRFAAGVTTNSGLGVVLTQSDKLVLSKILPLQHFGYYSLATTVASGLYYIIGPLFTAATPQFAQRAKGEDDRSFSELYHRVCQLASVAIIPVALVLVFFSRDVLLLWTRDAKISAGAFTAVSILTLGTMLHAMVHLPYAAQIAYGWTTLTMGVNAATAVVVAPLTYVLAGRYGSSGGAAVWLLVNITYVTVMIPLMHRRILRGQGPKWYRDDFGLPLIAAAAGVLLWRAMIPANPGMWMQLLFIGAAMGTATLLAAAAAPAVRQWVLVRIR